MRFPLMILVSVFAVFNRFELAESQDSIPGNPQISWDGKSLFIQFQSKKWKSISKQINRSNNRLIVRLTSPKDSPPILGKTSIQPNKRGIQYTPRFSFIPGTQLEIALGNQYRGLYTVPIDRCRKTKVVRVAPRAEQLPANLLKFYVHFSGPMQKGNIYKYLSIVDLETQKVVELPFLEIQEELWSRDQKRLTLFLDPGRIKRGLKPREEMGPIFKPGNKYALRISSQWPDAQARPLDSNFEKLFLAMPEDGQTPQYQNWLIRSPKLNSVDPLKIQFDEPLDSALAQRVITVRHQGKQLTFKETQLIQQGGGIQLLPNQNWQPGRYQIRIGSELEDLCGNRIGRAFDINLQTQPKPVEAEYYELGFDVK
ncbi:MAG: Ig-like domain-containing protein [Planctomycetota bacterium]|nr:Ig-like domain-containing protein [Planctomycetota bacterium]